MLLDYYNNKIKLNFKILKSKNFKLPFPEDDEKIRKKHAKILSKKVKKNKTHKQKHTHENVLKKTRYKLNNGHF